MLNILFYIASRCFADPRGGGSGSAKRFLSFLYCHSERSRGICCLGEIPAEISRLRFAPLEMTEGAGIAVCAPLEMTTKNPSAAGAQIIRNVKFEEEEWSAAKRKASETGLSRQTREASRAAQQANIPSNFALRGVFAAPFAVKRCEKTRLHFARNDKKAASAPTKCRR